MKQLYTFLLILMVSLANAQTDRQFWFVAPAITASHAGETPIYFRVTAGSLGANVTISMPANTALFNGGSPITQNIPANTTVTINVSAFVTQIENNYDFLDGIWGKSNKGIYIQSDNPVTVYYEDGMTNNCDIFALKGKNGLGTEFYTVFQNKGYNMSTSGWAEPATSAIDIVATEDGTVVTIESPLASQNLYHYGTANFSVTLNKGQTFTITPEWVTNVPTGSNLPTCNLTKYANDLFGRAGADHLGGLHITSNANHPIAITKKDDSVRYYCVDGWNGGCYDLIGDQMVPLDILGKEYIAMRGGLSSAPENVYCVATADNTSIYINGNAVPVTTINRGQTYVYELWNSGNNSVHIRGSNKLSVLHVSGFGCEVGGAILPPIDKCTGSTKVSVNRTTTESFFFNIMVWDGAEDGFYINGIAQNVNGGDPANGVLFGPADFQAVPGTTNWKIWRSNALPTNLPPLGSFPAGGTFTFENTKDVFHLGIINGGSSSGCRFGYFSDFNELKVDAQATGSLSASIRACSYEKIQLYAQGGTDYNWWPTQYLDDATSSTPISNPPADTIMLFYVEVSGACGLTDTATVSVEKFPELESQFSIDQGFGCSPLLLTLHEVSTQVRERFWDFNFTNINGSIDRDTAVYAVTANFDTDTTFTHYFINTSNEPTDTIQNYTIRLLAKNTNDCSDTVWATVSVYPEVTADFSISVLDDTIGCSPHFVQFVNNSNNEDAYAWRFGDGVSDFIANPTHTYLNILDTDTIYTARLVARSDLFCRDTAYLDFTIHPYLENGFTIDHHADCSPLDVTFTNNSVFADTIFLDFGDGTDTVMTTFATVVHQYTNVSNTVDTNVVEMIVKNNEGCYSFAYDTVIVYPEVIANYNIDIPSYTGCNSQLFNFTNTSNYGTHTAQTFLWTFGDGTNSNIAAVNVPHTYTNSTSGDKIYPLTLHAESQYGCFDDTINQIRINRAYADFTVDSVEGCSPVAVTLANTSIGTGITTWLWNFGDGSPIDNNQTPAINPHVYTNTTGATLTRNLQLTVTGTSGCSTSKVVPIDVYSAVDVSFTTIPALLTFCDSTKVDFNASLATPIALTTYQWDFGDGTSSSLEDPSHIYRNLTNAGNVNYTAKVTASTPNACKDEASAIVTTRPYVKAKFTVDKVAGCSPLTVDPIATWYIGIGTYQWDFGDGSPLVFGQDPPAHTYPANVTGADVTYTLRLDVLDPSGNCTSFATKTITVYSETNADFNPKNSTGCNEYTVTFNNLSFNAVAYKWDFDDLTTSSEPNPTHTFTNSTNAVISYNVELEATSNRGCTDIFNSNVSVNRFVNADFDIDISEGCSPVTVHVKNSSSGGSYYWFWDDDDLTLATRDRYSTSGTEEFNVVYTNNLTGVTQVHNLTVIARNTTSGSCYDTLKIPITVYSSIDAQYTYVPATGEGCNPLSVAFTNTTANASTYNWFFGDGSSTTTKSPTHVFTNNTTNDKPFSVKMYAQSVNGCVDSITHTITVYSKLVADFSIEDSEGCPPFSTSIENTSLGNPANTYQWLIDNVAVAGSPTNKSDFNHTYNNLATAIRPYNVKLIATNPHGCTSTYSDVVTVYEYVKASYSMSIDEGCTPLDIKFTDLSSVPALTKYTWTFGDGATSGAASPLHTFYNSSRTTDKPYNIKLSVQSPNYCTDDTIQDIMVYHQPLAKFFIDKTSSCPPLITNLTKESTGEDSFEWRFGDGSTNSVDANITNYTYQNTLGNAVEYYNLEFWVGTTEGCKDSTSLTLSVFPDVIADFDFSASSFCSPVVVGFTNNSSSTAQNFLWNFDDGNQSNLRDPVNRYDNTWFEDKVYNVFLKATTEYNCWDTITKPVTVFVQPIVDFSAEPVIQKFPENRVFIDNLTTPVAGPWNYLWEYGNIDASTSTVAEPGYFDYEHWGEKDIKLTVTSKTSTCSDEMMRTVTILPPDVNAAFTTNIDGGCLDNGLEVQFTAEQSPYGEQYQYIWDFGDGSELAYSRVISHTYEQAGKYYVKLTAKSLEQPELADYEYKTISVYTNPEANFEVMPKVAMLDPVNLEARVEFYNLSTCYDTSGCAYKWSFGDGSTSISRDVTHNYKELGKYNIGLAVTNSHGCSDTLFLPEEVEIIGAGEIAFPNAFTPNGDGLNDTFRPVSQGVIKYELLVYNRWGELIFKTNDLADGWNGQIKGSLAKPDVYVWKAQGSFTNGRAFEMAGDVTLIR